MDLRELVAEKKRTLWLSRFELPDGVSVATPGELARRSGSPGLVSATGAFGATAALVARAIAMQGQRVLYVAPTHEGAMCAAADLRFVFGKDGRVLTLLPSEISPFSDINPDRRAGQQRMSTLTSLCLGDSWSVLVTSATGLSRKWVPPEITRANARVLNTGDEVAREEFLLHLTRIGYGRVPLVEDPGGFAVRGSLIDLWPPGEASPVRVELFGDLIMSLRRFSAEDQRTGEALESLIVPMAREVPLVPSLCQRAKEEMQHLTDAFDMPSSQARQLSDDVLSGRTFFGADGFIPAFFELRPIDAYLPSELVVLLDDAAGSVGEIRRELDRLDTDALRKEKVPHFPVTSFTRDEPATAHFLESRPTVALHSVATLGTAGEGSLDAFALVGSTPPSLLSFDHAPLKRAVLGARSERGNKSAIEPVVGFLDAVESEGYACFVVARSKAQSDRIAQLLRPRGLEFNVGELDTHVLDGASPAPGIHIVTGELQRGITLPAARLCLLTEEDLFGARVTQKSRRATDGEKRAKKSRAFVEDLKSLGVGDHIVHIEHGVGRYQGLFHRDVGGVRVDLLAIEYAGGDKLFLPVYRLNQIEKFSGEQASVKLDRLGGQTFAKTKARAESQARHMADELLQLYAERRAALRKPFPPPDEEYRAFEATFPFDETEDQAEAIADVERDLSGPQPMDRLVCGDVGFGKTEVAMRAAFRVAREGRQVAILCPTTVLAQQHLMNFRARLKDHALDIRSMSRFTPKAEQSETLARLKAGTTDIVIGTHRLLSKDVHYKDLGLLVVDEEQRFGVTHKERIKQIRTNVDVLTLSATPIPRTLQMAISGLRDMSIIATPPVDRRAVRTLVTRFDEEVLREAILRELERGGQIFYVYNRVEGLHERAARLESIVPRARICVGHGQMSEHALERTMVDFVEGRYDILCATAIIESGLDIARANTMIIDRADMFGLSQLYQLRGRVGRSKERAYCYLVVPPQESTSDEARARILALEQHTELGSGFHVASLDLELRGAGDLLGADQSGTIEAVGFDLFCSMLEDAVAELRGEKREHDVDPEVTIDAEALIPNEYVDDVGVRLGLYKRLAMADSPEEVVDIAAEMEDRFGPPPESARRFVHLMRLKPELRRLKALGCEASKRSVTLHLRADTPLDPAKVTGLITAKRPLYRLTPDMRLLRRFDEKEGIDSGLVGIEKVLDELSRSIGDDR